jgi:hypothetical protein
LKHVLNNNEENMPVVTRAADGGQPSSSAPSITTSFRDIRELIKNAKIVCKKCSSHCITGERKDDENDHAERGRESIRNFTSGSSLQTDEFSNELIKRNTRKDMSLFGMGGDKQQRKVAYTKFSKEPREAIEVKIEDIPGLVSENHVVIKVAASTVSLFDCLIRKGVSYEVVDYSRNGCRRKHYQAWRERQKR